LKLLQKDVAKQLGVCQPSYNPLPVVERLGAQLVQRRTALGLTQKELAKRLGVDPGTLARWERGEREPAGRFAESVERFLRGAVTNTDMRHAG
jgi:DNA-binding XRE family transcriptional regulator